MERFYFKKWLQLYVPEPTGSGCISYSNIGQIFETYKSGFKLIDRQKRNSFEHSLKYSYTCVMKMTKRRFSVEKLQQVAKTLKTIAHPVKLEILELLDKEEPLDVTTIWNRLEAECELSMLSHHLTKMKDNGILTSEKQGKRMLYSITHRYILKIFDCMENAFND